MNDAITEAEEDMKKGYAQLVKDATDEIFHPTRQPHELNLKYAQKRINAMHGKAAKESAELSRTQIGVLEHLKGLADKQEATNARTDKEMAILNGRMLFLTKAGAFLGLIGTILGGVSLWLACLERWRPISHPQDALPAPATMTSEPFGAHAPEAQEPQPEPNKATPDSPAPAKTPESPQLSPK